MDSKYYFYVCNGDILRNLEDLLRELIKIDDLSFFHHVNIEKNDFANWVNDVLKDPQLSKKMMKLKDKEDLIKVVEEAVEKISKSRNKRDKKTMILQIKEAIKHG